MNRKKILYSMLKEMNVGNRPLHTDYEITLDEFAEIIGMAEEEGLISGSRIRKTDQGDIYLADIKSARITLSGIDYLEENSALAKTYRGLKEIRDWIK